MTQAQHRQLVQPLPGEIPLKQWVAEQALKLDLTSGAIWQRLARKKIPLPPLRRVNQRVVFVRMGET